MSNCAHASGLMRVIPWSPGVGPMSATLFCATASLYAQSRHVMDYARSRQCRVTTSGTVSILEAIAISRTRSELDDLHASACKIGSSYEKCVIGDLAFGFRQDRHDL